MKSLLAQQPVFLGAVDGVAERAMLAPGVAGPGCQKSVKCLPTGFQITVSIIWMTKLMTTFGGGM